MTRLARDPISPQREWSEEDECDSITPSRTDHSARSGSTHPTRRLSRRRHEPQPRQSSRAAAALASDGPEPCTAVCLCWCSSLNLAPALVGLAAADSLSRALRRCTSQTRLSLDSAAHTTSIPHANSSSASATPSVTRSHVRLTARLAAGFADDGSTGRAESARHSALDREIVSSLS